MDMERRAKIMGIALGLTTTMTLEATYRLLCDFAGNSESRMAALHLAPPPLSHRSKTLEGFLQKVQQIANILDGPRVEPPAQPDSPRERSTTSRLSRRARDKN